MAINLDGTGMCNECFNGDHRQQGETAAAVAIVLEGQTTLCNCPCHLPKKLLAPKPKRRAPQPEQTRFDVPTIFIGGGAAPKQA